MPVETGGAWLDADLPAVVFALPAIGLGQLQRRNLGERIPLLGRL
jgi:hypothetical protein